MSEETKPIGVRAKIAELLERNEHPAPNEKPFTDPQIAECLVFTFGERAYFRNVANLRCLYNSGRLTGGKKPRRRSRRYDVTGKRMKLKARYAQAVK